MSILAFPLSTYFGPKIDNQEVMARIARVDYPGAVHHVYARGIEKRKIYMDDHDRDVFLRRTITNTSRWEIRFFAWALMENHFHFLVRSDGGNLPFFMRCLLTGYSLYFNERHERVGHLFQNRYKSRLITKDSYLREAIRYVHLNPINSGHVTSLEDLRKYPWTGHQQILSPSSIGLLEIDFLKELFSDGKERNWRSNYSNFVESGYSTDCNGSGNTIDIERNFMETNNHFENHSIGNEILPKEFLVIVNRVSAHTGVPAELILAGGKRYREVNARRDLLKACKKEMKIPVSQLSRWLGISESSSSYLLKTKNSQKGSF